MTAYVPGIVYNNLRKFLEYRRIESNYTFDPIDTFSTNIKYFEYISIPGKKEDHSVRIILMSPNSKYATKSPEFRKLLNPIVSKTFNVKDNKFLDIIIISEAPLTNHIKKSITEEFLHVHDKLFIEDYTYELFKFVVPEHVSVPKHIIVPTEEAERIFEELYVQKENLPKIITSDPVAIWMGLKPGDVVKIIGPSESAGERTGYRYCVFG